MDTRKRLVPTYLARREPQMGQLITVEWRILLLAPEIPLQLEGAGKGGKHVRGRWRDPGFNIAYPLGRQMFEERIFALIDQGVLPVTHSDMPRGVIQAMRDNIGRRCGILAVGRMHQDGSVEVTLPRHAPPSQATGAMRRA
jgi:hypothetical protein